MEIFCIRILNATKSDVEAKKRIIQVVGVEDLEFFDRLEFVHLERERDKQNGTAAVQKLWSLIRRCHLVISGNGRWRLAFTYVLVRNLRDFQELHFIVARAKLLIAEQELSK